MHALHTANLLNTLQLEDLLPKKWWFLFPSLCYIIGGYISRQLAFIPVSRVCISTTNHTLSKDVILLDIKSQTDPVVSQENDIYAASRHHFYMLKLCFVKYH